MPIDGLIGHGPMLKNSTGGGGGGGGRASGGGVRVRRVGGRAGGARVTIRGALGANARQAAANAGRRGSRRAANALQRALNPFARRRRRGT
jgi:hypothetical protein